MKKLFQLLALAVLTIPSYARELPNILWIVSEDNGSNWLGCYGNRDAQTPRLDAMAAEGVRFTHAYSNAPVCAVARSTILNGAYAVCQGTEHMRSRPVIPAAFKSYVSYLRESGYYTTNNAKTDYNFAGNDRAIWDACSVKAHYKNRPEGQPFFAVFNLEITHESNLFPAVVKKNRQNGTIPATPRLDVSKLTVPPCMPDLPEVREDIAIYHDCMTALDRKVGALLDELKKSGLADDTIVLYYADHGGAVARGKRYLEDTGVRIPMILHVPEKWRKLCPFKPGSAADELVAFVDFAPTLLSICGLERPAQMQGRAFLGEKRIAPPADHCVFLFADRFDDTDGMRRGLTDGNYKYIRCFTPWVPAAPYSFYSLGQPSWAAMRKAWEQGKLEGYHKALWESPQPVERLFDTRTDPWEIHNLAADPAQAERLALFRDRLKTQMNQIRDTGVVPEAMWVSMVGNSNIYEAMRKPDFDYPKTLDAAFSASSGAVDALTEAAISPSPVARYWAAVGSVVAAKPVKGLPALLRDASPIVRIMAADAMIACGEKAAGTTALMAELPSNPREDIARMLAASILRHKLTKSIPAKWIADAQKNPKKIAAPLKGFAKFPAQPIE